MERGATRLVLKIGEFVIKFPNFTYSHLNFLNGCHANWSERNFCKVFKNYDNGRLYNKVAPSLFCSIFGLIQVQKYCKPLGRELTDNEVEYFKNVQDFDLKSTNFGIYKGRVVCLDYP